MDEPIPWRVRVLGWGNIFIGVVTPVGIALNILSALRVFSLEWAGGSIGLAAVLGAVLGFLSWRSGRSLLKGHPGAYRWTLIAGSLTLGYTFVGILVMVTCGIDRDLLILMLNGSNYWWNWSLSHFQSSALREIPVLVWWVVGLGTLVRHPVPGAPVRLADRLVSVTTGVFCLGMIGGFARILQMSQDVLLSSER